jgi:GDP-mannose 6-dehydrogenase
VDFDVCFNPEFLREGSAIHDFYNPPFTAIGCATPRGGEMVASLYGGVGGSVEKTSFEVAEMLKYACNSFHALKVTFANEIGSVCKGVGIDSHRVMDLFSRDQKLNISKAYLMPGFAFGGSCLPKDLRALLYKSKELDLETPLLGSVLASNQLHIQRLIDRILSTKQKKVGILGLSFKHGTDDLRDSPTVILVESLLGKGCKIKIYDSEVSLAKIFGANKAYIEHEIEHISTLMCSEVDEVLEDSDVIVVAKQQDEIRQRLSPYLGKKVIFDLVRIIPSPCERLEKYDGICW